MFASCRQYFNGQLLPLRWMLFFFQAEDGIRDYKVTGVQTCALPIFFQRFDRLNQLARFGTGQRAFFEQLIEPVAGVVAVKAHGRRSLSSAVRGRRQSRSEERRVGKECRSRWSPYH